MNKPASDVAPIGGADRVLYALVFCGLWGLFWLLVEGLMLATKYGDIPLWAGFINPGAGAPLILALAFVGALVSAAGAPVETLNPAPSPNRLSTSLRRWLWEGSPAENAWRSAWTLTWMLLIVLWFSLGVGVGRKILSTVVTPGFGAALILLCQLVIGIALVLCARLLAFPLLKLSTVVNRKFRPGAVLVACGGAGLLVFGLSWIPFGDVMKHLPWVFVVAPAVGLICAHFLTQMLAHRVRARKTVAGALLGAIGAMGLFALFLPSSLGEARALIVGRTSITSAWVGWLEHRLDRDKDGATGFFAGGDCAPDNPAIGPAQMEIVGNGIDDDCAAGDLEIEPADYIMGKNHHKIPEGITKNPHVIFITTDALSFRHTSLAGYHRDTTPHLKEWAKRATVFENAFSTSASTRLSFPGMLTGMLNSMVKMKPRRIHPYPYHESVPTLGTLFKKKGYRTVHLMGDSYFGKKKWGGYWQGFDVVDEGPYKNAKDKGHTAAELTRAALTHIESEDERPLFLWVHYYDHHEPYKNPKGAKSFGPREVDQYDSELHHTDKFWGLLLAEVESRWSPDEFIVVFTADHGEAFDANHPTEHHDFSLHTEVLHVPLIIQSPWGRGQRIEGLSSHLDILPTLADLSGIGTNPMWIGESLVPCLAKKQEPEKTVVYSMFYIPEDAKNHRDGFRRFGVRTKDFYYFVNYKRNTHRLVKWQEDRLDRNNLYRELPDEAALYRYLAADKLAWLRAHERGLKKTPRKKKKGKAKAATVVGAPGK